MTERRIVVCDVRACSTGNAPMRVSGMAARYNRPAKITAKVGRFVERIMPGAFRTAVTGKQDVALLINHDPNRLMARVSSGTLRLYDVDAGLAFDADLPDTEDARSAYAAIKRGDMHQCSFGFGACDDDWDVDVDPEDRNVRMARRTIRNIKQLTDVSAVTFPAYTDTSIVARSVEQRSEIIIPKHIIVPEVPDTDEKKTRRRQLFYLAHQ
jgi:HK97 family phage prohead protease